MIPTPRNPLVIFELNNPQPPDHLNPQPQSPKPKPKAHTQVIFELNPQAPDDLNPT